MSRRSGWLALAGWLLVVAIATAALQRAGTGVLAGPPLARPGAWAAWLAGRDPVVAALAILRLLAIAAGWYLLTASVAGTALRVLRVEWLVRVADCVTVPALRRLLVATASVTLASGLSPSFASASASVRGARPPAAVTSPAHPLVTAAGALGPPTTARSSSSTTTTALSVGAPEAGPEPTLTMRLLPVGGEAPVVGPAASAPTPSVSTWTVRPGECFWSIAEDVLAQAWGRSPTDAEIVPYWHVLIEENRSLLADRANPDLIFPAQLFTVPAPPPAR